MRNFGIKKTEVDHEFASLCFAMVSLTLPVMLVGFAITIWLAFFD